MKPLKKKVSITLDEDVLKSIRVCAEKKDRSLSQFINIILKQYLEQQENKKK